MFLEDDIVFSDNLEPIMEENNPGENENHELLPEQLSEHANANVEHQNSLRQQEETMAERETQLRREGIERQRTRWNRTVQNQEESTQRHIERQRSARKINLPANLHDSIVPEIYQPGRHRKQ